MKLNLLLVHTMPIIRVQEPGAYMGKRLFKEGLHNEEALYSH